MLLKAENVEMEKVKKKNKKQAIIKPTLKTHLLLPSLWKLLPFSALPGIVSNTE